MATSISTEPYVLVAVGAAALSALLILWHLIRQPALTRWTKVLLLFGIGLLPLVTAGTGNVAGYEATKARTFCGSCHVMTPYLDDALSPISRSLASRHNFNEQFGPESCYVCHADYGMFGTITTKMGGMRHVYLYLTEFHSLPFEEALPKIKISKPFQNATCMRCHSTDLASWRNVGDHASMADEVRAGEVSCISEGCHAPAHEVGR